MALTKETKLIAIRYTSATEKPIQEPETLWLDYVTVIDDDEDDLPPVYRPATYRLYADTDVSNFEPLVQRMHAAAFAK